MSKRATKDARTTKVIPTTKDEPHTDESDYTSIRGAYATLGVEEYYTQTGDSYQNPHQAQVHALLERAASSVSYKRVLDLCCGSGEVTQALVALGALDITGVDPYTHVAYERETGRVCARYRFSDLISGALDRDTHTPYSAMICSFAMHLCPREHLYALTYALFKHTETLVIITPHKRPALEALTGVVLREQLVELTPRGKRVTLKIYEMPQHPERASVYLSLKPPHLQAQLDAERRAHFETLEAMNARFYERFASTFHQTRGFGWPGWLTLLPLLPERPLTVIDLGCGNGRLTSFLTRRWCEDRGGKVRRYLGVDRDLELLDHARASWRSEEVTSPSIEHAEITIHDADSHALSCTWSEFSWSSSDPLTPALAEARAEADWVTLFGVLHHVYSFKARVEIVVWAAELLCVGGALSVSLWDFGADPRYASKQLSWTHDAARALDSRLIEEGDTLLGWRGAEDTPRFCHWMGREEEERWLKAIAKRAPQLSVATLTEHPRDGNRYWTWRLM